MNVAVIPARGGSKRIPRKNIKLFHGKPMIAWSINAAAKSGCFDRVIVSTDDEEIASVARKLGAETPFMRPEKLADDFAGTLPVMRHAVEWLSLQEQVPDAVCCIYATAPFIRPDDIIAGLDKLISNQCDYAFTVTSYPAPIQRAFKITDMQRVVMFYPDQYQTRSQDLEPAYHDAAQFYWGTSAAWLEERAMFSAGSTPIILPRYRVQDIDTSEDWQQAEWLFKLMLPIA
jgi:N-acylneuraminate cytidylyltransferase